MGICYSIEDVVKKMALLVEKEGKQGSIYQQCPVSIVYVLKACLPHFSQISYGSIPHLMATGLIELKKGRVG